MGLSWNETFSVQSVLHWQVFLSAKERLEEKLEGLRETWRETWAEEKFEGFW